MTFQSFVLTNGFLTLIISTLLQPLTIYSKGDFFIVFRLHSRRNKHHWQYWCDKHLLNAKDIEYKYILEMVADWKAMGKVQGNSTANVWYDKNKNKILVTDRTRTIIEALLYSK